MQTSFEIVALRQPPGSNQCGQTCVAMLLGVSVEEACKLVGTKGKTHTFQLVEALRNNGIRCASRRYRCRWHYNLPTTALLAGHVSKYGEPRKTISGHWMLWHNSRIYDPEGVVPASAIEELRHEYYIRLTSYLAVYGKEARPHHLSTPV